SAPACREVFDSLGLTHDLAALEGTSPDQLAQHCATLRRRIVDADIPQALAAEIRAAHAALVAGRDGVACAVRSSATAEDLAGASFAGQHGTYYYVGAAQLLDMIRRCWASLWSPEAASYRASRGIPHASVSMAVVVQEMVLSEVSGVTFTANPVSGNRGELVIESSWGMGAALVDGRVTPDRYVLAREGLRVRERRIAEKRYMVPARLANGHDERLVPVPPELVRREALRPDQVETIARWSVKCEEHFGAPQDVEWAITDGRVHLLQSRPITTLEREEPGKGITGKYVLFKPLAENFTDPMTPLSADLIAGNFQPVFRTIGGRFYANLDHFRLFIPFELSDAELADVLYSMFAEAPPKLRISLKRLPLALAAGLLGWLTAAPTLARTRGMPDDFMDGYRERCRRVQHDPTLDPAGAFRQLLLSPRLLEPIGQMPILVNATCLRNAPWLALLRRMLQRWAPKLRPDAAALLCSGSEGVRSAEMGREIQALAHEATSSPKVAELFTHHAPDAVLARLRDEPAARDFLARLDGFLAVHGHRAIREFELQAPRWAENSAPVLAMIKNHLLAAGAAGHGDKATHARSQAEAEVRRALEQLPLERMLGVRRRLVDFAAQRARYYFKLRENSRFYHIMALAYVRKKLLEVEADLLRQGKLKCRDDIFFLRWREVEALRAGRLGWRDVEDRLRERRLEHVRLAKITPPKTIGIERPQRPAVAEVADANVLAGLSASPGRYEGVARVILDPSVDAALRPGEVLVAPYTDPAWTPLFLTAGAAVVEVGSYLSHAGTVAREYGMPCVVDVPDATRRIPTGARVEVDGDRGLVRILDGGAA
ncbi:MAG: hypothetical protein HY561_04300, partial [Gemmatimonadetes bacterium]|nr:hypothetical protein [Gemmatimonadota bacterium]